jgi:phenylpropionate dioxygenase-like ring-hydroxylating dioxygenase large terminal subunit
MLHHLDGGIHVLYNHCAHRETKLIIDHTGSTSKFFPYLYHPWTYKTDGTQLGMPLRKGYDGTALEKRNSGHDMA